MLTALLDNDILSKATTYSLLAELEGALSVRPDELGVLGSAMFVLKPKRLHKASDGGEEAHRRLKKFIEKTTKIEPSEEETMFAARLESLAIENGMQFDVGESQLVAVTILRAVSIICTGDKRAIFSLEKLLQFESQVNSLKGKIISLETLIFKLNRLRGHSFMRDKICKNRGTDISVEICYQCHQTSVEAEDIENCLLSYINRLRNQAPTICVPLEKFVPQ